MRALSLAYTSIIGLMLLAILCSGCVVLDKRYVRSVVGTDPEGTSVAGWAHCHSWGVGPKGVPLAFASQALCRTKLERAGYVAEYP